MPTRRTYRATGASRSTRPRSTSCITAVAVKAFEIEPMRQIVDSGSTARRVATSARPYPRWKSTRPSWTKTNAAPGIRSRAISTAMKESTNRANSSGSTASVAPERVGREAQASAASAAPTARRRPVARASLVIRRCHIGTVEGRPVAEISRISTAPPGSIPPGEGGAVRDRVRTLTSPRRRGNDGGVAPSRGPLPGFRPTIRLGASGAERHEGREGSPLPVRALQRERVSAVGDLEVPAPFLELAGRIPPLPRGLDLPAGAAPMELAEAADRGRHPEHVPAVLVREVRPEEDRWYMLWMTPAIGGFSELQDRKSTRLNSSHLGISY